MGAAAMNLGMFWMDCYIEFIKQGKTPLAAAQEADRSMALLLPRLETLAENFAGAEPEEELIH